MAQGGGLLSLAKDEAARIGRFVRPVDEGAHGVGFGRGGLGVQQQHGVRFQPLGAVNGEQAHNKKKLPAKPITPTTTNQP